MLENKDLQAVVVSTPDHWHALMTMMSCAAGKDVYVEKPLTVFIREGRWMTDVARPHNRIVQVGTQQRSGRHYQRARELMQSGYIGKIMSIRAAAYRNIMPGFGSPPDSTAPNDFNYDMWLGPAPARPYNKQRGIYHFRWFWDYSGGQMTNLGAHEIDIMQWVMNVKGPTAVTSTGGRFAVQEAGETPDTQDALFEYPGFTTSYSFREASAGRRAGAGLEFFGTKGSLLVSRSGFEVFPDMKANPANSIPVFQGQPAGGPERSTVKPEPWVAAIKEPGSSAEQFDLHARNFLDCVKNRQRPIADVEGGHQVTTACHLANLSLRASAANFSGIRRGSKSPATPKPPPCSNAPIASPGIPSSEDCCDARRRDRHHFETPMELTRRDFFQTAALAAATASAAHSAAPPPDEWFDRPMRWAQLTLAEDDPGTFDLPFWLDYFRRTHSDAACLSAGGCVAYYPTKVPLHYRSQWLGNHDPFGELVAGCRQQNMVVIARTDPHAAHQDVVDAARPDWIAVNAEGNKIHAPR